MAEGEVIEPIESNLQLGPMLNQFKLSYLESKEEEYIHIYIFVRHIHDSQFIKIDVSREGSECMCIM